MTSDADRFLRLPKVLKRTGLSRATLYRRMTSGAFPKPVPISQRCVAWRDSAVAEWQHNSMFYEVESG